MVHSQLSTMRKNSLTQRILFGSILQIAIVVIIYGMAMGQSTEFMEENLISDMLAEELDVSLEELDGGSIPKLPVSMSLYSDDPRLEPIPAPYRDVKPGFTEFVNDDSSFVYQVSHNGYTYTLVRDQYDFEKSEQAFNLIIFLSSMLVLICGSIFSWWWIKRRVMQPVMQLTAEVQEMARSKTYRPLTAKVSDDEVGDLARICDSTLKRIHEALDREKLFTADVSHELRTPLTVIQTTSELLEMKTPDSERRELLEKIEQACEEINAKLTVFLSLARGTALYTEDQSELNHTLQQIVEHFEDAAKNKRLHLSLQSQGHCPGEYSQLLVATVAGNLIKNAIRYTDSGSVTVIETREGFEVIDTGSGVNAAMKEKIFEPFVRASDKPHGFGMGLSIAKRICDRCGWRLALLESESGSHFSVTLVGLGSQEKRPA